MSDVTVPEWAAAFFSADQWTTFRELVVSGLRRHQVVYGWDDGWAEQSMWVDHPKHGRVHLGLRNIAQTVAQIREIDEQRKAVGHHLRVLFATAGEAANAREADFAEARANLRIRLWPTDVNTDGIELVAMPVMPGVNAVLAIDLPEQVLTVPPQQLATWGVEPREAFALALRNTIDEEVEQETFSTEDGVRFHVHSGDSFYVASRALALERWCDAKAGALVIVPNRHMMVYHPIEDANALQAFYTLWIMAQQPYKEGPGSISPELFWWQPGKFTRVPMISDEEKKTLSAEPPAELVAVLQQLLGPLDAE